MKEKRCSYRVVICINDLPNKSVEDMKLNAQDYIKNDIEMMQDLVNNGVNNFTWTFESSKGNNIDVEFINDDEGEL